MLTLQEVENVPNYALSAKAIIVVYVNNHFRYWGAFNDASTARTVARAIGGKIIWLD